MANLYIQVENNAPVNHPAFEDNLIQAFNSVPPNWEPFVRVEQPELPLHQVLVSQQPVYEKVYGVWTDVWSFRQMTSEEVSAEQYARAQLNNALVLAGIIPQPIPIPVTIL